MIATDELRAELTKRGVEYEVDDGKTVRVTRWKVYGEWVSFIEYDTGETRFCTDMRRFTPAQAIAATLGPTDPRERGLIPHFWTGDWTLHVETERLPERIDVTLPDQRGREVYSARVHRFVPERTCRYEPDYTGFTWWDENDVEHYEEDSASDECWSASCNKCGFTMIVGDEGWFNGWDDIKVWTDEDDTEHHGILLEPIFKFCPNCGAKVVGE